MSQYQSFSKIVPLFIKLTPPYNINLSGCLPWSLNAVISVHQSLLIHSFIRSSSHSSNVELLHLYQVLSSDQG